MAAEAHVSSIDAGGESGFTLLELLVAIALFSFISLALFEGLHFGILAWGRGGAHADQADHVMFVQSLVRRLLEDAYPEYVSNGPADGHANFEGTATSVSFLATTPAALGGGGRSHFALSGAQKEGRKSLVLTSKQELADDDETPAPARTILLSDIAGVEFSYFGRTRSDKGPQWRNFWTGESSLPQLIRVQIQFPQADARAWPDLLVAPRITVDVGCAFDPLTKRCRGR
jgi:general secretion pathway protein J